MPRDDLKGKTDDLRKIEEGIRDAVDAFNLDQKHVDDLVDQGIEVYLFILRDRFDDLERRVAKLEPKKG